jgi:hypothetical protein
MRPVLFAEALLEPRGLFSRTLRCFAPALALSALLVGAGCSKSQEPERAPATPAQTATATAAAKQAPPPAPSGMPELPKLPSTTGPSDVTYTAPTTWQQAPNPTTMRKATYKIPRAAGDPEDAELAVSQATGGVDNNALRWQSQFAQGANMKRTDKKVGDLKVTVLEISGTYSGSGMPGAGPPTPKEKFMLLGAIVETTPLTFFKMTGPEKTMAAAKADFDKFVDSMRAK